MKNGAFDYMIQTTAEWIAIDLIGETRNRTSRTNCYSPDISSGSG